MAVEQVDRARRQGQAQVKAVRHIQVGHPLRAEGLVQRRVGGVAALPLAIASLRHGDAPAVVQPVGAQGQLVFGRTILDQALGVAADDLVAGDAANIVQPGDAGIVACIAAIEVQAPPAAHVQLVVAGQFEPVGAGVGDVTVERCALDVGVGRTREDRADHRGRQLVGQGDAVVDVDAVGIERDRGIRQRAPDQAYGEVGRLLGLERLAAQQRCLRAVGTQGALLHLDPVAAARWLLDHLHAER
ncbi:hypothetical protein D3C80_1387160 [compost metagenome]